MHDELWTEVHDIVQERDQDIPKKKKCKETKWLSEEALQIAVKRREAKSKGEYSQQVLKIKQATKSKGSPRGKINILDCHNKLPRMSSFQYKIMRHTNRNM